MQMTYLRDPCLTALFNLFMTFDCICTIGQGLIFSVPDSNMALPRGRDHFVGVEQAEGHAHLGGEPGPGQVQLVLGVQPKHLAQGRPQPVLDQPAKGQNLRLLPRRQVVIWNSNRSW